MQLHKVAKLAALGLALLAGSASLVHAQQVGVQTAASSGIPFMNGGVGKSEVAYMRKAGRDFELHVEFSERKDSEFIADANLVVTDMHGAPVFQLPEAGPIVNLDLPDGRYRVSATFHGQTKSQLVELNAKSGKDLFFHWQGGPKGSTSAALGAGAGPG
jgi:hypothetical protein